eukprot:15076-Heterococcus_DN1.PRE.2
MCPSVNVKYIKVNKQLQFVYLACALLASAVVVEPAHRAGAVLPLHQTVYMKASVSSYADCGRLHLHARASNSTPYHRCTTAAAAAAAAASEH